MSKGQKGMSPSDRGFAQVERDLRDLKRSGEYYNTKPAPVTMEEQIEHRKFLETFEGKYDCYGTWEKTLLEELRRVNTTYSYLSEWGIYPRTFKEDGYEKKIEPREFAKMLRDKIN